MMKNVDHQRRRDAFDAWIDHVNILQALDKYKRYKLRESWNQLKDALYQSQQNQLKK